MAWLARMLFHSSDIDPPRTFSVPRNFEGSRVITSGSGLSARSALFAPIGALNSEEQRRWLPPLTSVRDQPQVWGVALGDARGSLAPTTAAAPPQASEARSAQQS